MPDATTEIEVPTPHGAAAAASATGSEPPGAQAVRQCTIIEPRSGWRLLNLRELWQYRELLYMLAVRDVQVRYKQTTLGAVWALLQPLLMMAVFSVVLGRIAQLPSDNLPYPLFVFAGLLPWTFFSSAVSRAGMSLVGSERLITKIYFPRMAIPFAAIGSGLIDFAIALVMLLALMAWYGVRPGAGMALVPVVLFLLAIAATGFGTLLAALNVVYRDFRHIMPFLLQIWMFATPTIYMAVAEHAPAHYEAAVARSGRQAAEESRLELQNPARGDELSGLRGGLALNPVAGLIDLFRSAMLGGEVRPGLLAWSTVASIVPFIIGCFYFRRMEAVFADII